MWLWSNSTINNAIRRWSADPCWMTRFSISTKTTWQTTWTTFFLRCFIRWTSTWAAGIRGRRPRCTVPAGHELAPGRAAQRLHVVILQLDTLSRQPVQGRGFDLGAVVPDIAEALVVHQDEDDVGLRARLVELVPAVARPRVPVLPRQLNAPRLGDDEAEE